MSQGIETALVYLIIAVAVAIVMVAAVFTLAVIREYPNAKKATKVKARPAPETTTNADGSPDEYPKVWFDPSDCGIQYLIEVTEGNAYWSNTPSPSHSGTADIRPMHHLVGLAGSPLVPYDKDVHGA